MCSFICSICYMYFYHYCVLIFIQMWSWHCRSQLNPWFHSTGPLHKIFDTLCILTVVHHERNYYHDIMPLTKLTPTVCDWEATCVAFIMETAAVKKTWKCVHIFRLLPPNVFFFYTLKFTAPHRVKYRHLSVSLCALTESHLLHLCYVKWSK